MTFDNIDKLNLRLIKAFVYFFQFQIDVRYKANKSNIVFNALSRLSVKTAAAETCFLKNTFQISLITITKDLKEN